MCLQSRSQKYGVVVIILTVVSSNSKIIGVGARLSQNNSSKNKTSSIMTRKIVNFLLTNLEQRTQKYLFPKTGGPKCKPQNTIPLIMGNHQKTTPEIYQTGLSGTVLPSFPNLGGFPKLGIPFWGTHNKAYSILGCILRSPCLGKLQFF